MFKLFDGYEIRARFAPALIVVLPVLTTLSFCLPQNFLTGSMLLGSSVLAVALLYGASLIVRWMGHSIESVLWTSWGGAPSTRFLRWRDVIIAKDLKRRLREAVQQNFDVRLLSEEEEKIQPHSADTQIDTAFRQVRELLRLRDKEGLWQRHNAEYGFARNLLGSRLLVILLCLLGIVACVVVAESRGQSVVNIGSILNLIYCTAWVPFAWRVLPKMAKDSAERYAERAWLTFLALAKANA